MVIQIPSNLTTSSMTLYDQRWSRGHKARGQGQEHKKNPRTRPRTAFPRTDTLEAKDRNARGQGQGPRTQVQVLSKKKRSSQKFFRRSQKKKNFFFQAISTKNRFPKNFSSAPQNFNNSKNSAALEPRTGQFSRTWGLEVKAKAKDFKICPRGRPRGQGRPRGLHLCLRLCVWLFCNRRSPIKSAAIFCNFLLLIFLCYLKSKIISICASEIVWSKMQNIVKP